MGSRILHLYPAWLPLAMMLALGTAAAGPAAAPHTGVRIENAWARPTPPGVAVAAVYLKLSNHGPADRLLRLISPLAAKVQLHETRAQAGMMSMRELPFADLPAGGSFEAAPGGVHIMLLSLRRPLVAGERFPLTLVFASAGEVPTWVQVRSP